MSEFYKLVNKKPVKTDMKGYLEWIKEVGEDARIVAQDKVGDVFVSTVFLMIDHSWYGPPPLVFETMVFGGKLDGEMERYSTYEDAERGHAEMLAKVKASL